MMPLGCCFPFPCRKCNEPKIQTEALWTEYLSVLIEEDPTIGLGGISWYPSLYPALNEHKDRLVLRFTRKYQLREISREDVNQWMLLLQNRFDEIADKFNHAYKLYDDELIQLDNLGLGYVRQIIFNNQSQGTASSSSSATGNSKFKDTPTSGNSTKNNPTTETLDTSSGSGNSQNTGRNSGESTETYDYHDEHTLEEVNKLIDRYKQIDEEFVLSFNNMFIGLLSEWC